MYANKFFLIVGHVRHVQSAHWPFEMLLINVSVNCVEMIYCNSSTLVLSTQLNRKYSTEVGVSKGGKQWRTQDWGRGAKIFFGQSRQRSKLEACKQSEL